MLGFLQRIAKSVSELISERPFAVCSISAFVFIILGLYIKIEPLFLMLVVAILLLIILKIYGKLRTFLVIIISVFIISGVMRVTVVKNENSRLYETLHGEYTRIEGFVSSVPTQSRNSKVFFVDTKSINYRDGVYTKDLKIFVNLKTDFDIKYGDKVTLDAILISSRYYNPYLKNYYLAKGARFVATEATLMSLRSNVNKNPTVGIRNYIISLADKFLTGDARALFKALAAGDRSQFSAELDDNLAVSGLAHIVCVSGLHISIIGMCLYNLLKKKNRYFASIASFGAVMLFVLITGSSPSTIRAAIMFASFLISILVIRENDSFTALCFSAFVLGFMNPYVIFDYGFILSFLSVLGIEIFSYPIKRKLYFLPSFVADSVAVTISAQLLTLPVCINMFGYISVYSILANLLVSFFFLFALYSCFVFIFTAPFWGLNRLMAAVCTLFLDLIAAVANLCSNLPYSMFYASRFDVVELVCYYVSILLFVFRKKLHLYFICTVLVLLSIVMAIGKIVKFLY